MSNLTFSFSGVRMKGVFPTQPKGGPTEMGQGSEFRCKEQFRYGLRQFDLDTSPIHSLPNRQVPIGGSVSSFYPDRVGTTSATFSNSGGYQVRNGDGTYTWVDPLAYGLGGSRSLGSSPQPAWRLNNVDPKVGQWHLESSIGSSSGFGSRELTFPGSLACFWYPHWILSSRANPGDRTRVGLWIKKASSGDCSARIEGYVSTQQGDILLQSFAGSAFYAFSHGLWGSTPFNVGKLGAPSFATLTHEYQYIELDGVVPTLQPGFYSWWKPYFVILRLTVNAGLSDVIRVDGIEVEITPG